MMQTFSNTAVRTSNLELLILQILFSFIQNLMIFQWHCSHALLPFHPLPNNTKQGCTYAKCQVTQATFCVVASNICWPSVWNLLHFTILVPTILMWLPEC